MDEMIPHDPVNHPAHYTTGEREPDEISAALNDLEHAVKCEYAFPNVHQAMQRKFDRDMSVVTDARNAYDALRADLARVTAERDEVVEACRGTHMDEAAIASMWSYVREKIGIQHERDALRAALATAQREAAGLRECHWDYMYWPASDSDFETECGHAWSFNDGGITSNGVVFCHHCGGKVIAPEIPNSCIDCGDEISALAERCTPCAEAFTPTPEAGR